MSRSNGPLGQARGAAPQQWQHAAENDPAVQQAYAAAQAAAQAPQQRFPQGFGNVQGQSPNQPNGHQGYAPQAPAYQPQAYQPPPQGYAPQAADQGYYPPAAPPSPAQQPSYQPVFDRYAPAQDAVPRGYDPRQMPDRAPPQQYAPAPQQRSLYDSHTQIRGSVYDQWPQPQAASPAPAQPLAPPQRGYDFASYMPGSAPAADYHPQHAPGQQPLPPQRQMAAQHHQQQYVDPAAGEPQWQLGGVDDRHDEFAAHAANYAAPPHGLDPQGYAEPGGELQHAADQDYDADDVADYEEDEPRRGSRSLVMVSALITAIALGGGLAFAYKKFVRPSREATQVAKVSAPKGPSKTEPADPGGKQFPNQDSKLQNRLGDGTPPASGGQAFAAATPVDSDGGVKRVQTLQIGRDGSVSPPQNVPGMVVVQPPAPPAPVAQPVAMSQQPVVAAVEPAPPQPRANVITPQPRVPVAMVNAPTAPEPVAAAPVPRKTTIKPAAKKAPAARDDLVASSAGAMTPAAATAPVKAGGGGYVAVLASKGSKAEAERTNADMEQRFDVLKGKIFDVQEANLTAQGKGIVYRSVVGPPGSLQYANGVCGQLKAVGYSDCWPVRY